MPLVGGKQFKSLKVKARGEAGRGFTDDPDVVCDALLNTWDEFSDALAKIEAEERSQLSCHFNELTEDDPELGDSLFGEYDEFKVHLDGLDDDTKKKFAEEVIRIELIDIDVLQESLASK